MRRATIREALSVALATALCVLATSAIAQPSVQVEIEPGLSPRMTPPEIIQRFEGGSPPGSLFQPDAVVSLRCFLGEVPGKPGKHVVWIVRIHGRFVNLRTPPGVPAQVTDRGFVEIEDATGHAIAWGGMRPSFPRLANPREGQRLEKGR